ncbi:ras-related protein RABC2a isoform X2 [Hevea brasiliensis]|uniref:ras-related protein RABC2a isoform X2 n=1 Tax=Hevea brasiliensis TaxID=3981 RepID=UPI0025E1E03F|nr:ras-related protein RABC2a isoform X2 [Hevea brasiliensis]
MANPSGQGSNKVYSFKIVLIGDVNVGKTTLIESFVSGAFKSPEPTIGFSNKIKEINIGGKQLKLSIWDTAGQERIRGNTARYYEDADGIALERSTLNNLVNKWIKQMEEHTTKEKCVKILVGNKIDKESERVISKDEGKALADKHGFLFIESSAKIKENVDKCFKDLALKILDEIDDKKPKKDDVPEKKPPSTPQPPTVKPEPPTVKPEPPIVKPEPPTVKIEPPKPKSSEKPSSYSATPPCKRCC